VSTANCSCSQHAAPARVRPWKIKEYERIFFSCRPTGQPCRVWDKCPLPELQEPRLVSMEATDKIPRQIELHSGREGTSTIVDLSTERIGQRAALDAAFLTTRR
jgi:hypothetical protein